MRSTPIILTQVTTCTYSNYKTTVYVGRVTLRCLQAGVGRHLLFLRGRPRFATSLPGSHFLETLNICVSIFPNMCSEGRNILNQNSCRWKVSVQLTSKRDERGGGICLFSLPPQRVSTASDSFRGGSLSPHRACGGRFGSRGQVKPLHRPHTYAAAVTRCSCSEYQLFGMLLTMNDKGRVRI